MLDWHRLLLISALLLCLGRLAPAQDAVAKPSISGKIAADAAKLDLNTATRIS
ncbi:MAG TPA: hypothetical protein VNW54_09785 [Granulicella sp.]|jgi:hypothetical protein|nr:hypothetical protein [Granulicella sp.]